MITQLNPPIPVKCPKGEGWATFLNYPSLEAGCWWCVVLDETGELWWCPNEEIRFGKNWSMWRRGPGVSGIIPVQM